MKIIPGVYETRNRTLVGVSAVRPSGFIEGQTLSGIKTIWAPGGRWLDARSDSEMDLILRINDNTDLPPFSQGRRQAF